MQKWMKRCLSILIFIGSVPLINAQITVERIPLGTLEQTSKTLSYEAQDYPLVQIKDQVWVALDTVTQLPVSLTEKAGIYYLNLQGSCKKETLQQMIQPLEISEGEVVYKAEQPIYCGHLRSFLICSNKTYYLPIEALSGIWDMRYEEEKYQLLNKMEAPLQGLQLEEDGITSQVDYWMHIACVHLYWQQSDYIRQEEIVQLAPYEKAQWQAQGEGLYVGTIIHTINGFDVIGHQEDFYKTQRGHYKLYTNQVMLKRLEKLFPAQTIQAELKCIVGTLQEKERVTLKRAEKRYYFLVEDAQGKQYRVPQQCLRIIGESGGAYSKVTSADIEAYANLSGLESPTPYFLWTDLMRQKTYVLERQEGQWHLIKQFVCSTGKKNCPTPPGKYEIQYLIPYIGVEKGYRCKNALVFFQDYMYHSILFDKTGKYIKSGQYELGSRASHGCVRLSEQDSAWLYRHIPVKTTVWIH